MTNNEIKLLNHIITVQFFNGDRLNLSKKWHEQDLENEFCFMNIVNLGSYNKILNTNNAGSRALLGSLIKKDLISIKQDDFNKKVFWIHIYKSQFEKIKLYLQ